MPKLNKKHITRFWNGLFFLTLLVFWRFYFVNHLLQKEQMQLFLLTFDFLKEHLSVQGGFAIYLAGFIAQFFLNKWLAAILVSAVLILLATGIQKALEAISGEGFYLLSFVPAIGYHFLLFDPYYKLAGLVALVLSVWSLALLVQLKNANNRALAGVVLLFLNYWLLGGAFFLFSFSVILAEILFKYKHSEEQEALRSPLAIVLVHMLILGLLPVFTRHFLVTDHLLSAYFSRAFYQFSFIFPKTILFLLASLPIFVLFYGWIPLKSKTMLNAGLGVILFLTLLLGSIGLPDFAEEKEMRYDNLVRFQKWENIIDLAETDPPAGPQAKLALSLALAKTGQMSTLLFHFNPRPGDFFIPFNIQGQAPMIANEPCFYLGLINFSKMLCVETVESTPDESRPLRSMQRLAEDYIIDGEYRVAERYLYTLEKTLFYRQWAKEAGKYLTAEKFETHSEWEKLRKQQVRDDFYYQYDRMDAALISLLRSDPHNKMAYEYLMNWYLLRKDFDSFLQYLPLVNSMGYESFPIVFQEAVAYIKTLFTDVPEGLNQYPVSAEVNEQLTRYAQAFQQGGNQKPDEMKKLFGNTYWYYVHFTDFENE